VSNYLLIIFYYICISVYYYLLIWNWIFGRFVNKTRENLRFSRRNFTDLATRRIGLSESDIIGYNVQIMISPLPSYDELLNSAYANISLIADKTWTFDPEDPFRKLNHSLWIQVRRATDTYPINTASKYFIYVFPNIFLLMLLSFIIEDILCVREERNYQKFVFYSWTSIHFSYLK